MKLVGYIRVSSEGQGDNSSLASQREKIEAYCNALGHELIEVFSEVASGKNVEDRPNFQLAMEAVKDRADGIIAIKLDRIARNCHDVWVLVETFLTPLDKHLVLLDINVDTSNPTGRAMLQMMAVIAELERSTIKERCVSGQRAKKQSGGYHGGSPKFGYKSEGKELVPDEHEQSVIDLIKRHRRSGKSYGKIAEWLNLQGFKTKRGKAWNASQVLNALKK